MRAERRAACEGSDLSLWFPEPGPARAQLVREAQAICRKCDVRRACLDYALKAGPNGGPIHEGVWGGRDFSQAWQRATLEELNA